jgi:hypothetical protein
MAFMLHNSEYPDIGCTLEEFRNGDDYDYYMKIARVALVAAAGNSQGQDMQCWAKWISRRGADLPDHACAECVPHSEMIDAGFQCVYHQAIAAMAAREGE